MDIIKRKEVNIGNKKSLQIARNGKEVKNKEQKDRKTKE